MKKAVEDFVNLLDLIPKINLPANSAKMTGESLIIIIQIIILDSLEFNLLSIKRIKLKKLFFLEVLFSLFLGCGKEKKYSDYPISMLDIKKVELTDSFWLPKIKTVQNTTIAFGFDKCVKKDD